RAVEPGEELAAGRREVGAAELRGPRAVDASSEIEGEQLRAVADAERRDAERVDRRRAARQDHGDGIPAAKLLRRRPVRDELGVHARLADTPGDQLRVLAAEVDDEHRPVLRGRRGRPLDHAAMTLNRAGNWERPW